MNTISAMGKAPSEKNCYISPIGLIGSVGSNKPKEYDKLNQLDQLKQ
jgi:hypothetical protein